MNLRTKLKYGFTILGLTSSIIAHADLYVFGRSNDEFNASNGLNITTSTGDFFVPISDRGWWSSLGGHDEGNKNYIAGKCCEGQGIDIYNNYFTFDLTTISGTATSASLNLFNYTIAGSSVEYQLFDIISPLSEVHSTGNDTAIYNDLMSGMSYGSSIYNVSDSDKVSSITLNADGILALNSGFGGEFGIGGSIIGGIEGPTPPLIPEPETYAMLLAGLGLIGVMVRRRKQEKLQ